MTDKKTNKQIDPQNIKHWVFDLDNTLYPHDINLFGQVDHRMGLYIQERFNVTYEEAKQQQKHYFLNHGTTLRGLMTEHDIDPLGYLEYVHDIDFKVLNVDETLKEAIDKLPGEKFIYTNASTPYAKNVLSEIGLDGCFKDFFDIHDAEFFPKPDMRSYHKMIDKFAIDPNQSIMFEDIACNLNPAFELGIRTVWIESKTDWAQKGLGHEKVDHITADLPAWLNNLTRNL